MTEEEDAILGEELVLTGSRLVGKELSFGAPCSASSGGACDKVIILPPW